jgi:serine protease Do
MSTFAERTVRRDPRFYALLALPLAIGTVLLTDGPLAAAPAPSVSFAQPQFADVIAAVQPAVVKITVEKRAQAVANFGRRGLPFDPDSPLGRYFFGPGPYSNGPRALPPGNEPEGRVEGQGSGFIVDAAGYIVTNNHVISDAKTITVTLSDGRELAAKLIGSDPQTDLALIKVASDKPLASVAFGDSDRARVGDWVVAIGNPFGLGGTATAGIISARGRDIQAGPYDDFLQIDAPINSGNSGGPIIGADGKVIGVNTAIYSPTGGSVGIGFAIPARAAERIVADLRAHGGVTRGWLGVQIQAVNADIADALRLDHAHGALVAEVVDASPASRAQLAVGDVILSFGGQAIEQARDLSRAVAATTPGEKVRIEILRNGARKTLTAIIDRNANQIAERAPAAGGAGAPLRDEEFGLALGPLSDAARDELELADDVRGAVVVGVKDGGIADTSGVRPGDLIVRVNRESIADAADAARAIAKAKRAARPVVILVRRGDQQFFTSMKPA